MSREIDQRVVEMEFDNAQFESGIKQTLKSLDSLKDRLDTTTKENGKGLKSISETLKNLGIDTLTASVAGLATGFEKMTSIAGIAIWRLKNKIVDLGQSLIANLTVIPLKSGLAEYETQLQSVQTILANTQSKGTTMDDVTAALDELNRYADMTIYNFTQMTENIGRFTAAGVDLNTSVTAIKGIANLAAMSGSTSTQAATAMYQLSQAISSGTVKLQDWNSVVNAGMGGETFQNALIATAKTVYGTDVDKLIKKHGSFRESLSEGWLTADVLTTTLQQLTLVDSATTEAERERAKAMLVNQGYTEDEAESILKLAQTSSDAATKVKSFTQLIDTLKEALGSGWTKSWELIFGNFEQAKAMWTEASDELSGLINASSDARNAILTAWQNNGGRLALINSVKNIWAGLKSIFASISTGFGNIFPKMTWKRLVQYTTALNDLTIKFREFTSAANPQTGVAYGTEIQHIAEGIASAVSIMWKVISEVGSGLWKVTKTLFGPVINQLFGALSDGGKGLADIWNQFKDSEAIVDFFTMLSEKVKPVGQFLANGFGGVIDALKYLFSMLSGSEVAQEEMDGLSTEANGLIRVIRNVGNILNYFFGPLWSAFLDMISAPDKVSAAEGFGKSLGDYLGNILHSIFGSILETVNNIVSKFSLKDAFDAYLVWMKVGFIKSCKTVMENLAGIGESVTDFIDGINPSKFLDKLKELKGGEDGLSGKVKMLIKFAAALLLVYLAVKGYASMSLGDLGRGMLGLSASAAVLLVMAKIMNDMQAKGMTKLAKGEKLAKSIPNLIMIALALCLVAIPVKKLGEMGWEKLARGVLGIIAIAGVLAAFEYLFGRAKIGTVVQKGQKFVKGIPNIITVAIAMNLLVRPVKQLGEMGWEKLARGVLGIIAIAGVLAAFEYLFGRAKIGTVVQDGQKFVRGLPSVIAIAIAMNLLVRPVKQLGEMDRGKLEQGFVSLGILGAFIAGLADVMGYIPSNLKGTASLILLAASLNLLVRPIKQLGEMDPTQLEQGGVAVAVFAAALIGIATVLGTIPMGAALKGALAIAGMMVILGTAIGLTVSIVSGSAASSANKINKMSLALANASKSMSKIKDSSTDGAAKLVGNLGDIVIALDGINIDNSKDIDVTRLASNLLTASTSMGKIRNTGSNAKQLTDNICKMVKAIDDCGLENFGDISQQITHLGSAIDLFDQMAGDKTLDDDDVKNAGKVGDMMEEFAKGLPQSDTLKMITNITGENGANVTSLALGVNSLANALLNYSTLAASMKVGAAKNATDIADAIVELGQKLVNKGSDGFNLFAWLTGANVSDELDSFGTSVVTLGTDLYLFAEACKDVTVGKTGNAVEVAQNLAAVTTALHTSNTLDNLTSMFGNPVNALTSLFKGGDTTLSNFGNEVSTLGGYFKTFSDDMNGAKFTGHINSAVEALEKLAAVQTTLNGCESLNLATFANNISKLGKNTKDFADYANSCDPGTARVSSMLTLLEDIADLQTTISTNGGSYTLYNWTESLSKVPEMLDKAFNGYDTLFQGHTAGLTDFDFDENGVNSAVSSVESIFGRLSVCFDTYVRSVNKAGEALNNLTVTAQTTGGYIGEGLVDGLNSATVAVYNAGFNLGVAAITGINDGAAVESPSKKAFETGMYVDMGLANGLAAYSGLAVKAGTEVSEETLNAAQSLTDQFAKTVGDGVNDQPVIRPVLDLTNLQNGNGLISSMLGGYSITPGRVASPINIAERGHAATAEVATGKSALEGAIDVLAQRVNQLGEQILGMEVVLDSGELVGGIAVKMDEQLGTFAMRKGRGG